ncbi:MAG: hypothetical protein HYV36_05480 [Lentisphaerae bacterium]|nr:hypothetical protein [Lentisphaerota bacterium]
MPQLSLTKKQFQLLAGGIGGAIAFFVIIQLTIVPMVGSLKSNRASARELREQLDKAREVVGKGAEIQHNLAQTRADIRALATNMPLPVLGNYLLAREQQLRATCAQFNIHVETVQEFDLISVAGWSDLFKIYRVRVVGRAGVNDLARCFHTLQKRNPLLSISAINIVPQENAPNIHIFSFVVGWLIWADPDQRPAFLQNAQSKAP